MRPISNIPLRRAAAAPAALAANRLSYIVEDLPKVEDNNY
ncbi:unnamed protein product [Cercospora beticola]|nr:unnamed protein product [Cercospora beticola]